MGLNCRIGPAQMFSFIYRKLEGFFIAGYVLHVYYLSLSVAKEKREGGQKIFTRQKQRRSKTRIIKMSSTEHESSDEDISSSSNNNNGNNGNNFYDIYGPQVLMSLISS